MANFETLCFDERVRCLLLLISVVYSSILASAGSLALLCTVSLRTGQAELGPVYMEKSSPGKEGHPLSRLNFRGRLFEKKVDPFARANSAQSHALIVSP